MKRHRYAVNVEWTGNTGEGTRSYRGYRRDHTIAAEGKPPIESSSDPAFRGDPARYNPEELLVAALSSCHMLTYLHLCAVNHIEVVAYSDKAAGAMNENEEGSGDIAGVTLRPHVTITAASDRSKALDLHHRAHELCFIARSVKFPVETEAEIVSE